MIRCSRDGCFFTNLPLVPGGAGRGKPRPNVQRTFAARRTTGHGWPGWSAAPGMDGCFFTNLPLVPGGARRDRTADLNTASVALSQLSYGPGKAGIVLGPPHRVKPGPCDSAPFSLDLRPAVAQGDDPVEHRPVEPGKPGIPAKIAFPLELDLRPGRCINERGLKNTLGQRDQ